MRYFLVFCLFTVVLCVSAAEDGTEAPTTVTTPQTTTAKTTSKPSTTSVPSTSSSTLAPTPPPTPSPHKQLPAALKYEITEDNVSCIFAEFAAQFVIEYNNTVNNNVYAYLDVVNGTVSKDAKCINGSELTLPIDFESNHLDLHFVEKGGEKYIDEITLKYTPTADLFPGHREPEKQVEIKFVNLTLFEVKGDYSYQCKKEVDVTQLNQVVKFGNPQVDSFRTDKNKDKTPVFREAVQCHIDNDVNDMVPIAVGIALLALVVIVLIAYFIGRRRSRRLAYQSV